MYEDQLIGLRHPVTRELAQMSVMGANGEHLCLALYLGEESLHRFNLIHRKAEDGHGLSQQDSMDLILESRQLQISFERREHLSKNELAIIKKLGRKYRGNNWPLFRSFHPGSCPAPVNDAEAEWLIFAMEQIIEITPSLKEDPSIYQRGGKKGLETLTREFHEGVWRSIWLPDDTRVFQFPTPAPDAALVSKVAGHKNRLIVECQFQMATIPIGPGREASIFPYMLFSVDSASGFVLGMQMLSTGEQTHESLIASVPDSFLKEWDRNGICPASIHVGTLATEAALKKTAAALKIPLLVKPELPALDEALSSVMGFMRGGH